jgi:hypothetical protein
MHTYIDSQTPIEQTRYMTHCPMCKQPYNPDRSMQRLCRGCKSWHHVACLKGCCLPPGSGHDGIPELVIERTQLKATWPYLGHFLRLLRMPIQRGRNAGIVGNGMLVERAWRVYEAIRCTDRGPTRQEWASMNINIEEIDESNVGPIFEKSPKYYRCPTCALQGENGVL